MGRTAPAFGMQLPIQAQSNRFAQDWEGDASVDDLARIARTADTAGFDYIGVCDHVAIPEPLAEVMGTTWYDTIATLGWLAGITGRTRLLSHVYVPAYRHPALTAKAFATIDRLSGGRAILGVGAGHVAEEFTLLGVDFERRGAILDDRVLQVKALLEEQFVDGMGIAPRPEQQPRPPIWIGGSSDAAIRRAALTGEGWLPQGPPANGMHAAIATIAELRDANGLTGAFSIGSITPFLHIGAVSWETPRGTRAGTPEELAALLVALCPPGVTHLQVRFASRSVDEQCEQIAAFASSVAPLLSS